MAKKRSFYGEKRFYPDEHFPHGIARSGEFTVAHTELLERYGIAYSELHGGTREPIDEQERAFLEVCRGEREPLTEHEKAWARFCLKTRKKHSVSAFGRGKQSSLYESSDSPARIDEFITE